MTSKAKTPAPVTPDYGYSLIFVGGAPRSGTTLLQRILNAHPEIYGGPEFDLIPSVMKLRSAFLSGISRRRIDKYFTGGEVDRKFRRFIYSLFEEKATALGVNYISEKTPSNVTVFPELCAVLPEARYILVLRDPRAIVSSMLEVGRRRRVDNPRLPASLASVSGSIRLINEYWTAGFAAQSTTPNLKIVFYEDLVLDSENTVRDVCGFLGIEFSRAMLRIESSDMEVAAQDTSWHCYTSEQLSTPITRDSLWEWRRKLSDLDLLLIGTRIVRSDLVAKKYPDLYCSPGESAKLSLRYIDLKEGSKRALGGGISKIGRWLSRYMQR